MADLMMADLMMADGGEADRGGPQELLSCEKSPTTSMAI
jgi:hypothetical protein